MRRRTRVTYGRYSTKKAAEEAIARARESGELVDADRPSVIEEVTKQYGTIFVVTVLSGWEKLT